MLRPRADAAGRGSDRAGGFSLIELMMVIVISAILLAIAVPNMRDFVYNTRRASAINELLATMAYARQESLKRGAVVVVCATAHPDRDPQAAAVSDRPQCSGSSADWAVGWLLYVDRNGDNAAGGTEPDTSAPAAAADDVYLKAAPNDYQGIDIRGSAAQFAFRSFNISGTVPGTITFCDPRAAGTAAERRAIVIQGTGRASVSTVDVNGAALACS